MRILIVINSLQTGGAEKLVVDSIPLLLQRGCEVELAILKGTETPFFKRLSGSASLRVHRLSNGSLYNPALIFKIRRLLTGFDIVHVHLFPALYWTAIASWFKSNKPALVFTEHNTTNRRRKLLFKLTDRLIYRSYSKVIAISAEVKNYLSKHINFHDDKFSVILNGIDLSAIDNATAVRPIKNDESNIQAIIMVASFYPQKDQDTLIRSMAHLDHTFHLFLVGDGPLRSACESKAEAAGLTNRVHFLGLREDVPGLLKGSDIVVLSSNFEGVSLSALEAMASGTPFIASRVPGLKELVGGYGILFERGNAAELAVCIERLVSDKELCKQVTANCRNRAMDYDLGRNIDEHLELYRNIINE